MDKKSDTAGDESFLGRWSRRKRAEPEKREVEDVKVATYAAQQRAAASAATQAAALTPGEADAVPADLPNVDELTPSSDYRRFMQPDVPHASRNAAMKKLFTDPHFNVMDGLDTYIDDYTKEDPIPLEMLKDLAQSRMLRLFETDEEKEKSTDDTAETVAAQGPQTSVPQDPLLKPLSGDKPAQLHTGSGAAPEAAQALRTMPVQEPATMAPAAPQITAPVRSV